ncbi:MAG TPA: hypothetical protein HPP81_00800 [Deltaproteobacteria bacterium]|jgi:hypothetical protein|nr:hypothetical protein [Deltaproteobacteria bacterium]
MKNEKGVTISELMGWKPDGSQEEFISVLEANRPLRESEEAQSLAHHSNLIVEFLDAWANGVHNGPNLIDPTAFGGLVDIFAILRVMLARLEQWEIKQADVSREGKKEFLKIVEDSMSKEKEADHDTA